MFIVAQLGARMHYAVPSILARADLLERLYTDTYAPDALRSALSGVSKIGPAPLKRWLGRVPFDIPENKIVSFNRMALEYFCRQRRAAATGYTTADSLWVGREFCRRIVERGLGSANAIYTFSCASLELLRHGRSRGLFLVLEQTIAPKMIESQLIQEEEASHPGWEQSSYHRDRHLGAFQERERMEWEIADLIVCGSEFVREGIRACGGSVNRCRVIPYGFRATVPSQKRAFSHGTLRVLTVGAVGLRKGAPYIVAAARSLKNKVQFRMAGQLNITSNALGLLNSHVELLGIVPRSEIQQHFAWADVFLLPSICEGSATACYEALAFGLPVITTPNCGSVVRDGVDGFLVPIRSAEAIVEKLELLATDRDLLALMSKNARERSAEFTLEKYGDRLLSNLGVFN